jgi:hypothetical protein
MNIGGRSLIARLMRSWMLLLIVAVVALAGSVVYRVHGLFGSDNEITRPGTGLADDAEPFDPKLVTYEVFGTVGAVATINYLDLQAVPQKVANVPLPWSITLTTPSASASATVVAQGDGNTIGCRVVVNDEVKAEHSSDGVNAQTFCLVKSA